MEATEIPILFIILFKPTVYFYHFLNSHYLTVCLVKYYCKEKLMLITCTCTIVLEGIKCNVCDYQKTWPKCSLELYMVSPPVMVRLTEFYCQLWFKITK